jgi:hypothetical protein
LDGDIKKKKKKKKRLLEDIKWMDECADNGGLDELG